MIPFLMPRPSNDEIDVVIPVIDKDLAILPLCLLGIKTKVSNIIKDIYIVAPPKEPIINYCKDNNLLFIDETTVLGFGPRDVNLFVNNETGSYNRSGWLFQQLIKLSGKIGTCDHYLCIDADHILLKPHTFLTKKHTPVLYLSEEKNPDYKMMIKRLLPNSSIEVNPFSYVAHKMIFSKNEILRLQQDIEKQNKCVWYKAIIEKYDKSQLSGFSEFELYGNYVAKKTLLPWSQMELKYTDIKNYDDLVQLYGHKYYSITFPEWLNQ